MKPFAPHPTGAQQSAASQQIFQTLSTEIEAYLVNALTTQTPFRERLVQFWANHFALMANRKPWPAALAHSCGRRSVLT